MRIGKSSTAVPQPRLAKHKAFERPIDRSIEMPATRLGKPTNLAWSPLPQDPAVRQVLESHLGYALASVQDRSNYSQLGTDPVLQRLSVLTLRSPAAIEQIRQALDAASDDARLDWLRGHVAYVERDFARAAACYDHGLRESPNDRSLWIYYAFCLRQLHNFHLANFVLFNTDACIRYFQANRVRSCVEPEQTEGDVSRLSLLASLALRPEGEST